MKMKRICLFLALVLLAALTFSAFAQEDGSTPTEPAVVDDGFAQDAAEETATGVGGFQRYVFEGKAEGCTTVTFTYGRSWEAEAPLYTLVYDIAVDSELQVTIVATTFTEGAIE